MGNMVSLSERSIYKYNRTPLLEFCPITLFSVESVYDDQSFVKEECYVKRVGYCYSVLDPIPKSGG